jgi:lipopolysaccharide transport system permease protein
LSGQPTTAVGAEPIGVQADPGSFDHVISPPSGTPIPDLRQIWAYRDLLRFLARRDVAVRYKQTVVGIAWAVLQPLMFALVLSAFLGLIFTAPSAGVSRATFVLCGMTVWLFFAEALTRSAASTLQSSQLISKVWFPRLLIPLAALSTPLLDFAAGFVVLLIFLLVQGVVPGLAILSLPIVVALGLLTAFGAGLWLSALAVRYRDVQIAVPFII